MSFPMDTSAYKPIAVDPFTGGFTPEQFAQLQTNIQVMRDLILFFTAVSGAKGQSGHTGGAYSISPEVCIATAFMAGSDKVYPIHFDEAGHRVATQYALSALHGEMPIDKLLVYRAADEGLYGHPELDAELGIKFASGRLGHMWAYVNGVAKANADKVVFLFGSDGSQMEGNDAEAARLAVAQQLNVKVCVDDNNVTISGHPNDYLPGFDVARTLEGHGLTVDAGEGEDLEKLVERMLKAMRTDGPVALVNRRKMAPGIPGIEGSHAGHEVVGTDAAIEYLQARGHDEAADYLSKVEKGAGNRKHRGSSEEVDSNRNTFGKVVSSILDEMPEAERVKKVLVVDSDLEGSTGLKHIRQTHPEVCINGGVQERGNLSAAAGFGFEAGRQGIFSTFSAFLEMVISELTMARLNESNIICHFSHAGVDEIADNTCHFGINLLLADCMVPEEDETRLYFAADAKQLEHIVRGIWNGPGARFVFSTRSKVPFILDEQGAPYFGDGYTFTAGKDEVIREGAAGYVVSYGETLYRALDAVERLREEGVDVGLINKPTLNVIDTDMLKKLAAAPFVLVAEGQNIRTGVGSRMGTWFLDRGLAPKRYKLCAVHRKGAGGIAEHMYHQGLDADSLYGEIRALL